MKEVMFHEFEGRIFDFDYRKAQVASDNHELGGVMAECKRNLADCLINGGLFVLNIDDSPNTNYTDKWDPVLLRFHKADALPIHIKDYKDLSSPECISQIIKGTSLQQKKPVMNPNFFVVFWSRFKLDEALDGPTQRRRVEERFEQTFNIMEMDVIFVKAPKE